MKHLQKEETLIKKTESEIQFLVEKHLADLKCWNPKDSFIELELELCRRLNSIGALLLERLIPEIYGDGYMGSRKDFNINSKDPENRTSYRCESRDKKRSLRTVFGYIQINRALYSEFYSGGSKAFLDERLDIEGKRTCPLIKYWSNLLGTIAPFGEAADILNKIRGISMSKRSVELSTEKSGEEIKAKNDLLVEGIKPDKKGIFPAVEINLNLNAKRTVYIETDGCQINTKHGWKECKTFMLFEIEKKSEDNQVLKNKFYYSTMGDSNEIKRQLKYHLERYCGTDEVKIVCVSDGAKWIWNIMKELFPCKKYPSGIVEIIDFYHAIEKIGDIKEELFSEDSEGSRFFEECKSQLKKGNIGVIEQSLYSLKSKQNNPEKVKLVDDKLRYFMNNKERMRYEKFKDQGLCIGSGAIESANKYVVQRRVKLQGMRWNQENLNHMVHLRAEYINNKMDAHYSIRNNPLVNQVAVN